MRTLDKFTWAGALLLAAAAISFGQQTGITGRVSDPSAAVIANVAVSVTGPDGTNLHTLSNATGTYQFPTLRASTYVLRFEAPGFSPAERTLTLLVGQVATVDVQLDIASASSTVEVESAAAVIDSASSAVAGDVSPNDVKKLPLNGRNYLQLAMLVPGITSNDVTYSPLGSTDNGKIQINVDGQQVTQNAAGDSFGQPQYSQDAIDQFQIVTNRFDATQGRSSRLQVNVQTKAGSNKFHGTLYGYFRNDAFNASDPVAHRVLPFSDQQFGGTVGGPILKDKLFFFFAYEGERQPNTVFLTPTGFPGQNYSFATQLRSNSYLFRTDWQIDDKDRLSVRASGYTWGLPENVASGSGTSSPTRLTDSTRTSYSVLGTWTRTGTPNLVNELKIGFNHFDWVNSPLVNSQEYDLPGGITIGGPYNYPQHFIQNTEQYRDDVFWLKGNQSLKFGGEYLHTAYTGLFQQNIRGRVTSFSSAAGSLNLAAIFPSWSDPSTWNLSALGAVATTYVQGFGNFNIDIPVNAMGGWAQNDWKVTPKLTLNLGLRYDNDLGIFDPSLHLKNGIQTPTSNDNLLFQPRVGFAYDPAGTRKTVIRGGAGIFYADIQANQVIDQQIFNGETSLQPSVQATSGHPISLTSPFGGATGDDFLSGRVPVNAQAIQPLARDVRTPYSLQMSIGIERQLTRTLTVSADYVHWRIYHDWIRDDANLFFNPATGYNQNPSTAGRPNPDFTTIATFYTPDAAGSLYDGLQIGLQQRLARNFTAAAAYTFARLKDSTTSPFYYPNNPFDLAAEWANSPDDQRHTLTVSGSYNWLWGVVLSGSFHYGSGQAQQVTAAANPFNASVTNRLIPAGMPYYGSPSDLSQVSIGGVPYGLVARDSLYGLPIARVDLRLSKTFSVKERFRFIPIVEAFNLLNHSNFGTYNTVVTAASFGTPAQNTDLAYAGRMLQFAGRFEF